MSLLRRRTPAALLATLLVFGGTTATVLATEAPIGAAVSSQTYNTVGIHAFTVPAGVSSITIDATGAAGADSGEATGGHGARAVATFAVTPTEEIQINVGGQGTAGVASGVGTGGFNGGADGGSGNVSRGSGGGGGASDARFGACAISVTCSLPTRGLVAGGGGGSGTADGANSNLNGTIGDSIDTATGGGGGTQGGGGAAGSTGGVAGAIGDGGAGGNSTIGSDDGGGGGGGGLYGGGGGGIDAGPGTSAGGGSGSSTTTTGTDPAVTGNVGTGNGTVTVSWGTPAVPLTDFTVTSDNNPAVYGSDITYTATAVGTSGDGGVPTGTVDFEDGAVVICDDVPLVVPVNTSDTALATCTVTAASGVGSSTILATYSGDANYTTDVGTVSQTLSRSDTTTVVTQTVGANPSSFGGSVTFQAHVAAVEPGAGLPTGTAQFFSDSVAITGCATQALDGSGNATCATAALTGGAHDITAAYSNDDNFNASTSSALAHTVNAIATSTALTTSDDTTVVGESITFTAAVTAASGTPAGSVAFKDGSTAIPGCTAQTTTAGVATCVTTVVAVGTRSITAVYAGSASHSTSTSNTVTQTVAKAATTTGLVSGDLTTVSGESVTFTAVVSPTTPGSGVPDGTVAFKRGATNITGCATSPVVSGTATCVTSALPVGTSSITAAYSGSTSYIVSTSSAISQVVSKADTSTSLVSATNPSNDGQSVTFTATVGTTAPGSGTPTGSVSFFVDGVFAASGALGTGTATYTTSGLSPGEHSVVAFYTGSPSSNSSTSNELTQVVRTDTNTAITSSADPSTFGGAVTFTATISPVPDGGTVQFRIDDVDFGSPVTVAGGVAVSGATSALTGGEHTVVANYSGTGTFGTSTDSMSQTVGKAASTTAMSSAPNPSTVNESVTLTATVSSGAGTPTGTVTFFDDTTNLGTASLSGGTAILAGIELGVGSHQLHAVYGTSNDHLGSTSPDSGHTVNQATTGTALASSLNPSQFGDPVTFTATVTQTSAGTGTPAGTVQFFDGITQIGSDTLDGSGVATTDVSTLAVASHSITAVYVASASYATSTSTPVVQVVNAASTATVITSSDSSSTLGQSVTFTASVTPTPDAGTVQFQIDSVNFGSPVNVNGQGDAVSGSTSSLTGGTHTVDAVYSGTTSYAGSTATQFTQTVGLESTATALTSSVNPSVFGQSVTVTATVTSDVGTPDGNVVFKDGSTTLATVPLTAGAATFTTSAFAVGTHALTADYAGSVSYVASSDSLSQVVNKSGSATTVVSDNNPSARGDTVVFTVTVAAVAPGSGTPGGTLTIVRDGVIVATPTLSGGVATYSTSSFSGGEHTIVVSYSGNGSFVASGSTPVDQVVTATATTTGLVSSDTTTVRGESVTFTATVSSGVGTPTGTVSFQDDGLTIGTGTLDGSGVATFTSTLLAVGTHPIVAVYDGNTDFVTSTSNTVSQVVAKAATTTGLVSSDTTTVSGESVTFTATTSATAPGTGIPTGTITFKDGASTIGTGTLNGSGVATFSTSALSVATHPITAVYGTSTSYLASTSNTVNQVVAIATPTVVLTSGDNPSDVGGTLLTVTVTAAAPGTGTPTGSVAFFIDGLQVHTGSLTAGTTSFDTGTLTPGHHDVVAFYSGSPTFDSGTSNLIDQIVREPSELVLTSSTNPSVVGQMVTFTATVTSAGTPTGSVAFLDDGGELGGGTLNGSGVATFTTTAALALGTHAITAEYDGNGTVGGSSDGLSQVVNQAATTTVVGTSPNPSVSGQSVAISATVSVTAPGAATPTGTIEFFDGATSIGTGLLNGSSVATINNSALTVGSHSLTAVYAGNANLTGSTASAATQTVNQAATSGFLTSSPDPSVFGQSATFTATFTATAPGTGTPTGTVTFFDGATNIGTATLASGAATLSTASLTVGTHATTAVYGGNASFTGSTSNNRNQVVNQAGVDVALDSTPNPSLLDESVTFTATASATAPGAGTPTGSLTFEDDGVLIGTGVMNGSGTATFTTSALAIGSHPITASYAGSGSFATGASEILTQSVGQNATTTVVTSSPNPSVFGQTATLSATVESAGPSTGIPSGTVTFFDGATNLGTATLASGAATFTTSGLTVGGHTITAVYNGDVSFSTSTSTAITHTVAKASTTTALVPTPNPSVFGQTVALTATVTAVAPGAGTATGTVSFFDGATLLGTGSMVDGTTVLSTSSLSVGAHSLTSVYNADASFSGSTSSAATQVVNPASTSTTVTSSPNSSRFGQATVLTATVVATPPGSGTPTGTITFTDGVTTLGTSVVGVSGDATLTTSALAVGDHLITAVYNASTNFTTSTSIAYTHTVVKSDTTATVVSNRNPSQYGQQDTFTVTVAAVAPGAGTPTGTVTFSDGSTVLSGVSLVDGSASMLISSLAVGTHPITVAYLGDGSFNTSTSNSLSQVVNQAVTSTTVTSAPSPSVFGQTVTLTATVARAVVGCCEADGTVTFMDGSSILGTGTLNGSGVATLTTTALSVASHSVTAIYAGSASFITSTSGAVTQVVNKAATTTTAVASPNPSVTGQSVTITATVTSNAPGSGTPDGSVTFTDGVTPLATVPMNGSGFATYTSAAFTNATHVITAAYGGSSSYLASSNPVSQVVNKADTTVVLTPTPNPSVRGQDVTLTATVSTTAPGTGTPTGTVAFKDGATTIWVMALTSGTATILTAELNSGSNSLTAVYNGSASSNTSTSSPVIQVVTPAATTTALTSNHNPSAVSQPVTFTATVAATAPGGGTATGTVTFKDGATTIGTGALNGSGVATFTTSNLTLASHPITAVYAGVANYTTSTSSAVTQVVDQDLSATEVTSNHTPSVFGQSVTLTATVTATGTGTPAGTVTFKDGTDTVGTDTLDVDGLATYTTSDLTVAMHTITAVYAGDADFTASTSPDFSQSMNKAPTATTLRSSGSPSTHGDSVTFTARARSLAPGAGVPTGTMAFFRILPDNTRRWIGNVTLVNGVATMTMDNLPLGTTRISSVYRGSDNFITSETARNERVNP